MKIAWANHVYLDTELCATTQLSVIEQLRQRGNDIWFFVPSDGWHKRDSQTYHQTIFAHSLSRHSLVSSVIYNVTLLWHLGTHLFTKRPDVVIIDHLAFGAALPFMLFSKLGLTRTHFIFDVRSQPVSSVGMVGKLREWQYRLALKVSDTLVSGVTFLTPAMAEQAIRAHGLTNTNVGTWSCGVDEALFTKAKYTAAAEQLRAKLGLNGRFVVFYHGVLTHNRGLQDTIRAMNIVKRTRPEAVLVLLGTGPAQRELSGLVKQQGLASNVRILPTVPHTSVPKYVAMSNVGIIPLPAHPDWDAQHPLKLSEYLAMELPVILTDIPAHRRIVGDNPAGLYIPSSTPEAIAARIEDSIARKSQLPALGKQGRRLVLESLTWQGVSLQLENFLRRLR